MNHPLASIEETIQLYRIRADANRRKARHLHYEAKKLEDTADRLEAAFSGSSRCATGGSANHIITT